MRLRWWIKVGDRVRGTVHRETFRDGVRVDVPIPVTGEAISKYLAYSEDVDQDGHAPSDEPSNQLVVRQADGSVVAGWACDFVRI